MPRSFSRSVSYIIIFHHFHQNVPHHFPQQDFLHFWQCFCTEKRVQNQNSQKKDMRTHATTYKLGKNALKIVFLQKKCSKNSVFEYPDLGHRFSVTKMVRITPDFG